MTADHGIGALGGRCAPSRFWPCGAAASPADEGALAGPQWRLWRRTEQRLMPWLRRQGLRRIVVRLSGWTDCRSAGCSAPALRLRLSSCYPQGALLQALMVGVPILLLLSPAPQNAQVSSGGVRLVDREGEPRFGFISLSLLVSLVDFFRGEPDAIDPDVALGFIWFPGIQVCAILVMKSPAPPDDRPIVVERGGRVPRNSRAAGGRKQPSAEERRDEAPRSSCYADLRWSRSALRRRPRWKRGRLLTHAYYLFLAGAPQGCEDCYVPLLISRQPWTKSRRRRAIARSSSSPPTNAIRFGRSNGMSRSRPLTCR